MTHDRRYRYVDHDGLVHLEARAPNSYGAFTVVCKRYVAFGETWQTDPRLIVTCMACAAGR